MSLIRYYDRDGKPLTVKQWMERFEHDNAYRQIASDMIGKVRVSTVWLGLDHGFVPGRPPLIFETMVFGGPLHYECDRYSTEAQALAGHKRMVQAVANAAKQGHDRDDEGSEMA